MWDQSDEDFEVPDAAPPRAGGNLVRQWVEPSASEIVTSDPTLLFGSFPLSRWESVPSPEPISNNGSLGLGLGTVFVPGDTISNGRLGQGSGSYINSFGVSCLSSDTSSEGKLHVTNLSETESSIEAGDQQQPPWRTPYYVGHGAQVTEESAPIYHPRPSAPGRGQRGWSSGTSQPRQQHVDNQRYRLPPPLRSPPAQSARPRHVSQPVSRPEHDTNGASSAQFLGSIKTGLTALETTKLQAVLWTLYNVKHGAQDTEESGRGQHGWSSGTPQPRQQHVDNQRYRLPELLRSPPAQSARPRDVPRPVSRPERDTYGASPAPQLCVDLHPPSLEHSSENDTLADHRGCPPECRRHSYSAVLFYAAGDEQLALTVRSQLEMLHVSHLEVRERRVRVALFPHVSPSSTPAETFCDILHNDITPYIFILRTMQYQNSDRDNTLGDWMITQAVAQSLSIIQIDFEQQKFEKPCLTKLIFYDSNSQLFQKHMRELLRGKFLDEQVRHDDVRKKCKHSRTADLRPMLPTPPPKATYHKRRKPKQRQSNRNMKEESSATSSSGHQGDISNNSDAETERSSWSSDASQHPSSAETNSKGPGNNRPEITICPEENGGHLNPADSRSGEAPTDSGSVYIPLQRENGNSSDTQSGRASDTKEDIMLYNRISSTQTSDSTVSDEGRFRQDKNYKQQINHSNSSSNNNPKLKQNRPVKDESSSSQDVASDSGSRCIKDRAGHENPDSVKRQMGEPDGHLPRSGNSVATHPPSENSQDRNHCTRKSATSRPGSRPSVFPQSKPLAVVFPCAPQSQDQTTNDENTMLKSYVREAQHETDISLDRQNTVGCEQDLRSSVNPNRTVTLQEDITGQAPLENAQGRNHRALESATSLPSTGSRPSVIPRLEPSAPQSADQTADNENTRLKSYGREAQHETDISPERQNVVACEQHPQSSANPNRTVILQEDITGRVRHDDTHQQHMFSPQQFHTIPQQPSVRPQQSNASSRQHHASREQRIVSTERTASQHQLTIRTQQHIVSPQHHTVSQELPCSQQYNTNPRQHAVSPQEHYTRPQQDNESPKQQNTSSEQHTVSPQEHSISSQQHTVSPEEHNTSFQQHIVRPQEHNTSPPGHTASARPQQYTCGPQQNASQRNSSASAPKESSTSHIRDKNGCSSHAEATSVESPPEVESARYDGVRNCCFQRNDNAARQRSRPLRLWDRVVRSLFARAPSKKKKKRASKQQN